MLVTVIGTGSWGTAVARHLGRQGNQVVCWSHNAEVAQAITRDHVNPRYLSDCDLGANVVATTDYARALEGSEAVVFVTPSMAIRQSARDAAPFIGPETPVVVLTKGIEHDTQKLMTDVVCDEIGNPDRIAALSGPNHAEEISRDLPAAAVIASTSESTGLLFQSLFHSDLFRTYVSRDIVGVEICAAAKNVVAIACGIAKGVDLGDNTKAVLMTRGLAEMSRLVSASGGDPLTCMGLAGMGDLVATCTSAHSRNQTFGAAFASGETLEEFEARTHMVVEGARACRSVRELAAKLGVEVPLTQGVYNLLYEHAPLQSVAEALYARTPSVEFYGI